MPSRHDDQQADPRSPHAERDPDDTRRLSVEDFAVGRGDIGRDDFDAAHCILVRSRGVTSTVATSAARLTNDIDRRQDHDQELDHGNVANPNRVAERSTNAGVVEDGFHDDDAGSKVGDVERDDLENRTERRWAVRVATAQSSPAHLSVGPSRHSHSPGPRSSKSERRVRYRGPRRIPTRWSAGSSPSCRTTAPGRCRSR